MWSECRLMWTKIAGVTEVSLWRNLVPFLNIYSCCHCAPSSNESEIVTMLSLTSHNTQYSPFLACSESKCNWKLINSSLEDFPAIKKNLDNKILLRLLFWSALLKRYQALRWHEHFVSLPFKTSETFALFMYYSLHPVHVLFSLRTYRRCSCKHAMNRCFSAWKVPVDPGE